MPDGEPGPPGGTRLLEIGRIGKPHGVRGDVLVRLTTNVDDRLHPGLEVRLGTADGPVARVESARPHQDRWIVRFAGVAGREGAEALRGTLLLAEELPGDDDPDALWIHRLIGAEVVDVAGRPHGRVVAVLDNPASDLLELDGGALVPLTFVVAHDGGTVVVDPPAGLLDEPAP